MHYLDAFLVLNANYKVCIKFATCKKVLPELDPEVDQDKVFINLSFGKRPEQWCD